MANMQIDEVALEIIDSVRFGFYTTEEIREISVKAITKPDVLDAKNAPVPDGLYDPALGPIIDKESCKSCLQKTLQCPGHCGHIDLVKPVYNPLLFQNLKGLLQIACFHCHRFKMVETKVQIYVSQLELILHGDIAGARNLRDLSLSESFSLEEHMGNVAQSTGESCFTSFQYAEVKDVLAHFVKKSPRKKCENCGAKNPKITCPTFGWLNKVIHGSDIRANFIQKSNLGIASIDGDQQDTIMVSDTENGEVLQSGESARQTVDSKEARKGLKDLPGGFIEQMNSSGQSHLLPPEVEHILDELWKKNSQLCKIICDIQCKNLSAPGKSNGYEMFFLKALLVPPSKFRPPAGSSGRGVLEHPQNVLYSKVLEANNSLRSLIATNPDHPDIVRKWMDLQRSVNTLFDSSKGFGKSDRETSGLRQLLEKKTGILRQKMMGKRVNFACRSVISPDPYLAVNEIGIPPYFALRLTYPERVTPWNVDSLRHAVENGADVHPGATHYKDRETVYKLQADRHTRNAISRKLPTSRGVLVPSGKAPQSEFEGKVVYRHLKDGDIVLVNRQPTLHKPSMMAHVVRVLPGERTIRMHYANCSTYNADFDGDEMNVHLPQDEISRAEAKNIVNANEQYIVPSKGEPIRGLIQDHIVGAVLLTKKDTFLTRDEYHQLLCACVPSAVPSSQRQKISTFYDDIKPLPPAIWKPTPLWTGKQAISAVLHYITRGRAPFTIEKPGMISKEYFSENSSEHTMHVYNNELIHGVIDKSQFGGYGLVHTVHELYGANTAGTLLSLFSRLFTLFLQMHGFTCGVDDLIVVPSSNLEMERILEESGAKSEEVHRRFTGTQSIDLVPKELHDEIEKVIQRNGDSATTLLDVMTCNSVAKITSEINRTLFPNGLRKPFPLNCFSLMTSTGAKGNQVNFQQIVSLLGQQLLEGKRVPRMISGKTLPCFPSWDISCRAGGFISDRFLTGLRPQEYYFHCMAGREGLVDTAIKTSRSGYLQRCIMKNLECLKVCYDYTVRDADGSVIQFTYGEDGVDVLKSSFLSELKILATNHKVVLEKLSGELEDVQLSKSNGFIKKLPPSLSEEVRILVKEKRKNAATHLSKKQQGCMHQIQNKDIMKIVELKYLSSLADPGESVGVLAAQSIGEPSTQMTLNTFHNAGRGETNVTLGIPRLQEILMNAKEFINTPIMKCPLLDGKSLEDAEHLAARFRRISVADVVESMEVVCIDPYRHRGLMSTLYKLKMKLYPIDLWPPPHSDFTIESLNGILEGSFVLAMEGAINKHLETLSKTSGSSVFSGKESSTLEEGGDEDAPNSKNGNDEGGDGDNEDGENTEDQGTDVEKRRRQATDEMEYDDGNEKASSRGEGDRGGAFSGSESEVDQAETDEDFMMDGGIPNAEAEVELPESSSKLGHSTSVPESGKKARKPEIERKKTKKTTRSRKKIERVIYKKIKGSKFEAHFIFRGEEPCILLEEIAKMTAKQVYLKEYKKIEQCLAGEGNRKGKEKDKKFIELQTAGVNFTAFWDLEDHLNINKLESNDIHAMLKTYGVEAARATIINEVMNVFSTYGIKVNIRHLSLIADFMTSHGGYRAMNRLGMGSFSTSPFSKMTFETATKFIFEAASRGEVDEMESPSASVSLGQPVKLGTGCFGLMHNLL